MMNPDFKALLQENGVDGPILRILELDGVTSEQIFHRLKSQHMARLLEREGMPVGAHALLLDLWERTTMQLPRSKPNSTYCCLTFYSIE